MLVFGFELRSAPSLSYKESHALVIAASNYTNGWPSLPNVVTETKEVQSALESNGFQVRLVENPDESGLQKAMETFLRDRGSDPDNRLLVYFSGYGFTSNRRGYLVPVDAPELAGDGEELRKKALSMAVVLSLCREIKARHVLFLFDSCFHDAIFPSIAIPTGDGRIGSLTGRPVRQFISAGTAGERLPEKSVFSRMFVRALRGDADQTRDGSVTGTELGRFLRDRVTYYETGQVPQYGKIRDPDLDEGDFVLILSDQANSMGSVRKSYMSIYELITLADSLNTEGQGRAALEKYLAADRDLKTLRKAYPSWNANIVNFRLKYLSDRIAPLQVRFPRAVPNP